MMSATSLPVFDGHHGHGLGPGPGPGPGGPHHIGFIDSYTRGKLPSTVSEFTRPHPKPIVPRYNGQRPPPSASPRKDYQSVPVSSPSGPVNLTSVKHESDITDSQVSRTSGNIQIPHFPAGYSSRMYPPHSFHYPSLQSHFGSLYPSPYSSLLRPTYINSTPLSPLERQYSPPQNASSNPNSPASFLQAAGGYSNQNTQAPGPAPAAAAAAVPPPPPPPPLPPPSSKPGQSLLREKRPFKVPPGKETNGKQRLLNSHKNTAKRVTLPASVNNNNNNLLPSNFTKGALIQLGNGDLKRVEDVTTEDLVSSADRLTGFRLDPSTVVRIENSNGNGTVLLTLSFGENKNTVEIESTLEHPYFVYGQGWASCSPERTMNCYGLQCTRLQVGDVCISLTPRQAQQQQQQQQQQHPPQLSPQQTAQQSQRSNPVSNNTQKQNVNL